MTNNRMETATPRQQEFSADVWGSFGAVIKIEGGDQMTFRDAGKPLNREEFDRLFDIIDAPSEAKADKGSTNNDLQTARKKIEDKQEVVNEVNEANQKENFSQAA